MPNLNVDMKSTADFAVKSARDRFQLELDYSDQSIARLENIVTQIYWGFSSRDKDAKDGIVYNTALIWGSYLGEFMRQKWGGTWVLKGSDPLISIKGIEFSPITLVYQKITDHPEYSLEAFLIEAGKRIPPRVAPAAVAQYPPSTVRQPKVLISSKKIEQPRKLDRRLLIALAGIVGLLFVALILIVGYRIITASSIAALGLDSTDSSSIAAVLSATSTETPTPYATSTPFLTPTLLPTYTPKPTLTLIPSNTPLPSDTPTLTFTPTETQPSITPSRTPAPTRRATPTNTHVVATEGPAVTATFTPRPPTDTPPPPPPAITGCEINPSSVPAGSPTTLTFIAHFNYPGYQFTAVIQAEIPGANGCDGSVSNSDGTSQCTGSSGLMPSSTKVDVKFSSSVGECTASYSSP